MKDFGCADCVHVYKSEASNCNCWCHKQRRQNTQPWSNLCLCLQEQYLAAICNTDERYLCSSTISFANQTRVAYLYLGAYLRIIAAIHETGYMNNALNGEGKEILLYTNTVRKWYSQVTNLLIKMEYPGTFFLAIYYKSVLSFVSCQYTIYSKLKDVLIPKFLLT